MPIRPIFLLQLTVQGGPGQLGINSILTEGYPIYRPIVGTNYDIVSFDPRGIGRSLPVANCSISTSSKHRRRTSDIEGPDFPAAVYEEVLIPQLKVRTIELIPTAVTN